MSEIKAAYNVSTLDSVGLAKKINEEIESLAEKLYEVYRNDATLTKSAWSGQPYRTTYEFLDEEVRCSWRAVARYVMQNFTPTNKKFGG